ncbi:unnamed protein product [Echinostoma caproni]|uniref:COesterase domain-containing protein n=1 Tax=Echinostoma caproni TaxID=27848 RepID=A0A183AB58_9TREM|nr:unnamed protein product [Echinostoma caproni]
MAISFFFRFGAYQACACSEQEFDLPDVFEAAAAMVQKLMDRQSDEDLRDKILLFFNTENTVEGFKPVYTAQDISQGCVIQILLSGFVKYKTLVAYTDDQIFANRPVFGLECIVTTPTTAIACF